MKEFLKDISYSNSDEIYERYQQLPGMKDPLVKHYPIYGIESKTPYSFDYDYYYRSSLGVFKN
jgi:hypothetical protein